MLLEKFNNFKKYWQNCVHSKIRRNYEKDYHNYKKTIKLYFRQISTSF